MTIDLLEVSVLVCFVASAILVFQLLMRKYKAKCEKKHHPLFVRNVPLLVVNNSHECALAISTFLSFNPLVIGLDCEWKPYFHHNQKKNRVALLQISHHKLCVLIRMQCLSTTETVIESSLVELLLNRNILKCGLNITGDCKKLYDDYHLHIRGCIELSHLIKRCNFYEHLQTQCTNDIHFGRLDGLSKLVLDINMNKDKHITLSNWEVRNLTDIQLKYAADDAIISYFIFLKCFHYRNCNELNIETLNANEILSFNADEYLKNEQKSSNHPLHTFCEGIIDVKILKMEQRVDRKRIAMDETLLSSLNINDQRLRNKMLRKQKYQQITSRFSPLYENFRLFKPDGKTLIATCSRKTVNWYLKKDLAVVIENTDGKSIQLKFEPQVRDTRVTCNDYYRTSKVNQCVVCGVNKYLIKYYIVPQCYRRLFPIDIKSHSSHDIVLLCHACHCKAFVCEDRLRKELCNEYNVPMLWLEKHSNMPNVDLDEQNVGKACSIFMKNHKQLPEWKKCELLQIIEKYYQMEDLNVQNITQELLKKGCQLLVDKKECNHWKRKQYELHAKSLLEKVMNGNISEFIQLWRKGFVQSMQPKFLPDFWSIHASR